MFPYMQGPPFNPREWIEALEDYDELLERRKNKEKDKDKKKDTREHRKGFSGMEIFLILTLLSPVCGPLYLYAVIAAARHIGEMLQQIH